MTHTVVGLFDNKTEAHAAMQELIQEGFTRENIDVSARRYADSDYDNAAANSTTGSTAGSMTSTNDTNTGVGGSISNFFNSLFGDDDDQSYSRNYTDAASDTEAILTVQADSSERASQAAEILDRNGAIDVDERAAQYRSNYAQTSGTTGTATENEVAIPIIEEELQVGKREVERGGARIRSRVIEKPIEETLRLREEHIVVNRHSVNRAVTDSDLTNFKEGEIELTEHAEEAVVAKQARVVEEVTVGKQVEEREQVVSDTVRRTDVEVEEFDENSNTRRANS